MNYEESLRQAKALLQEEIRELREQLAGKEASLRKIEAFLREPYQRNASGRSLTQQVVALVERLANHEMQPVSAKRVVREFMKERDDVNESTIRSTLYQVSRKQKPTEIIVDGNPFRVRVLKQGPMYSVQKVVDSGADSVAAQEPLEK